mmetsp:Transcript_75008/g.195410  ORF Transcript_75008/g.195410 Transcript_75008/m.195410 type:complete len:154 (-) Transcript_75008:65-526(-)
MGGCGGGGRGRGRGVERQEVWAAEEEEEERMADRRRNSRGQGSDVGAGHGGSREGWAGEPRERAAPSPAEAWREPQGHVDEDHFERPNPAGRAGGFATSSGRGSAAGSAGRGGDPADGRGDNILCAVLALIKELDAQGLELVRRAIEQRQGEV